MPFIIFDDMENNNVWKYGEKLIDTKQIKESLNKNQKRFAEFKNYTPEQELEFNKYIEDIYNGIESNTISTNGKGVYEYLPEYTNEDIFRDALGLVDKISKGLEEVKLVKPIKTEEVNKPSENFDITKHGFLSFLKNKIDPYGSEFTNEDLNNYFKGKSEEEMRQTMYDLLNDYFNNINSSNFTFNQGTKEDYLNSIRELSNNFKNNIGGNSKYYNYLGLTDWDPIFKLGNKPAIKLKDNELKDVSLTLSPQEITSIKQNGFTENPITNTWIDANGNDTGVPLTMHPRPDEIFNRLTSKVESNEEIDWDSFGKLAGALALNAYLIFSPDPISSTIAGITSDVMNYYATDENKRNGWYLLGDIGTTLLGSAVPYIGDLGNVLKSKNWAQKFFNITKKALKYGGFSAIAATAGIALNDTIEYLEEKESWDIEDWKLVGRLALDIGAVITNYRRYKNKNKTEVPSQSTIKTKWDKFDDILKTKSLNNDQIKEIRTLVNKVPNKRRLYGESKEFQEARAALIDKAGYPHEEATKLLKDLGLYKEGGVLKALTGIKVTGTPNDGKSWYSLIGSLFLGDLAESLKLNFITVDKVNNMQDSHFRLNLDFASDIDSPSFQQSVLDYLRAINKDYTFVNTKGINNGEINNRYKILANPTSGDTASKNWFADGFYSGRTLDRTLLGREGDYTAEELTKTKQLFKDAGYDMYLNNENKYYYLKPFNSLNLIDSTSPEDGNALTVIPQKDINNQIDLNKQKPLEVGEPLKFNKELSNLERLLPFSMLNYLRAIAHNNKLLREYQKLPLLLVSPFEFKRYEFGNIRPIVEAKHNTAEALSRLPQGTDIERNTAAILEVLNLGRRNEQLAMALDDAVRRLTAEAHLQQEKENAKSRFDTANINKQSLFLKLLKDFEMKSAKNTANYTSGTNLINEINALANKDYQENRVINNYVKQLALTKDIKTNPQNYILGWTNKHNDLLTRYNSGDKSLTQSELIEAQELLALQQYAILQRLYPSKLWKQPSVTDVNKSFNLIK